ncbi:MAG: VanZ family protein [Paludibacter sp.]|nr:VanZ family protein [Paludibacter sp.]HPM08847.1 VanZ family protein [Paludibacter sp.]
MTVVCFRYFLFLFHSTMHFISKYWKTILVTIVILVLSFVKFPILEPTPKFTHTDKIIHFGMYAGLTIVLMLDYHRDEKSDKSNQKFLLICLSFPLLIGLFTEILQGALIYYRDGDIYDVISNSFGVLAGWGVFALFKKNIKT